MAQFVNKSHQSELGNYNARITSDFKVNVINKINNITNYCVARTQEEWQNTYELHSTLDLVSEILN